MFQHSARVAFGVILLSTLVAGAAAAEPWQVIQSSGPVWFGSNDAVLVSLGSHSDIPGGDMVVTGEGGRAMLVRGQQTMLVGPNTVIAIPDVDEAGVTTVLQRAGEVTFDVDRQKVQHFAVETPYLAAVVKGTSFKVSIDEYGAAVAVDRGLVQVTDLATGDYADTPAGQFAKVNARDAKFDVGGSGILAAVFHGPTRAPLVAPLAQGDLQTLQSKARTASGSIQALNPSSNKGSDLVVIGAGAGAGGSSGGSSGGTGNGTQMGSDALTAGGGSNANGTPLQNDIFGGIGAAASEARAKRPPDGVSPFTFALAAAFMTLLAIGLAYVRRNN